MVFTLKCNGIYIAHRNGCQICELAQNNIWFRTSTDILDNTRIDTLIQFFMQNVSKFRNDYSRIHIPFINGIYILLNNNTFDVHINIAQEANGIGHWYNLDIFNTDINNSIAFFLLHTNNGFRL